MGEPLSRNEPPETVFEDVLAQSQASLINFARGLVGDWELARDITQDIFIAAWHSMSRNTPPFDTLDDLAGIRRWLFTVAYRQAIRHLRRRRVIVWEPLDDTCPLRSIAPSFNSDGTPVDATGNPTPPFEGRAIDLRAIPNRLPAASLDAVIAATQKVLDSSTSSARVLPGDHYIAADGSYATATQAFDMAMAYRVSMGTQAIMLGDDQCAPFCAGQGIYPLSGAAATGPGAHWTLLPVVRWQYTLPNGQPVTVDTEQADGMPTVDMAADWTGAWQVDIARMFQSGTFQAITLSKLGWFESGNAVGNRDDGRFATAPADGYLLALMYSKTGDITTGQTAYVLYRAGALIALDSNAHQIFPSLPVASAHEMAIARQLGWE